MKAIEYIKEIARCWDVNPSYMAVTYSPKEGLFAWWIESEIGCGYKSTDFVKEAMMMDKNDFWWWRREYGDELNLDTGSAHIHDEDEVDMGAIPFIMSYKDFYVHYKTLHAATYQESDSSVNMVGVDYEKIKQSTLASPLMSDIVRRALGSSIIGKGVLIKPVAPVQDILSILTDSEYPTTFEVGGIKFKTVDDVDKYIRYRKLTRIVFMGEPHMDEVSARHIISNLIKNQSEVQNLMKGL